MGKAQIRLGQLTYDQIEKLDQNTYFSTLYNNKQYSNLKNPITYTLSGNYADRSVKFRVDSMSEVFMICVISSVCQGAQRN